MNDIGYKDRKNFAKRGYDDKPERNAFKKFVKEDDKTLEFLYDYMNLETDVRYKIVDDPLGERRVDLGIVNTETGKLVGIVEVDVYESWKDEWPKYYKWNHRLLRKEKYYIDNDLPYINITFNTKYTSGICSTRELEQKYPVKHKEFKQFGKKDYVREIPLDESIKIGEW